MSETGRNLLKITKLDLSGQKLEEIPEYVYQCRNLRKLILHENNIGKIPSKIKALKRLRLLDLSNNKLSVINSKGNHCIQNRTTYFDRKRA